MLNENGSRIHIAVIIGTRRPGNYTSKATRLVVDEISKHKQYSVDLIDPATMALPFPGEDDGTSDAKTLQETVSRADGVILATPEYHGSFSSVIKLVIENMGFPSVLAGKPVSLLGVAAGRIGAIKSLESLRGVCSHIGAIVLPGPVSIAGVQQVFDDEGNCVDEGAEKMIRSVPTNLMDYIQDSLCPRMALEAIVRSRSA